MKNILLVDDDQISVFLISKALELSGKAGNILTASNCEQALTLFKNDHRRSTFLPDVIFLDLNMPGMDGFGFLSAFADLAFEGKDKIRIIVLSSSINIEDFRRAKALGASGHLSKPLTIDQARDALAL